jgi:hypothetical protein
MRSVSDRTRWVSVVVVVIFDLLGLWLALR